MSKIFKLSIIIFLINFSFAKSETIKPSINIKPAQVIKIQLQGLMKNDAPYRDKGIEQTWEFAHPSNQRFTGPLSKFKEMIKGDSYSMLLNHIGHETTLNWCELSSKCVPSCVSEFEDPNTNDA